MKDQKETYSDEFKKAIVEKLLRRNKKEQTLQSVADELGVHVSTLYDWKKAFATQGAKDFKPAQSTKPQTAEEKLNLIIKYESLPEEKKGEFLRKNGLHKEHIEKWSLRCKEALSFKVKSLERIERSKTEQKIKELEKELKQKDKALANASALLVLKKKANLIWGVEED